MTLRGLAPASWRWTFSDASASASASAFGRPRGALKRIAQLAVDLDRQGHLVVDQQRRIEARPGGIGDHAVAARCAQASSARCGAIGAIS